MFVWIPQLTASAMSAPAAAKMHAEHYVEPGGVRGNINLSLIAVVPNSPSLFDVVNEQLPRGCRRLDDGRKKIDVSLANATGARRRRSA